MADARSMLTEKLYLLIKRTIKERRATGKYRLMVGKHNKEKA